MKNEALELQTNTVNELLRRLKQGQKEITLKAPTGSGKTRMMAALMNEMLESDDKLVFLVSSLSKGNLARQNYESFAEVAQKMIYPLLKPFYISSGGENAKSSKSEYGIDIDSESNVYVLPLNQYSKGSRIYKEGILKKFLQNCHEINKRIILIRDEAHIQTSNLKLLNEADNYFSQTLNFSATPKNDKYDVELKEKDAVAAGLIKEVEYRDNSENLEKDLSEALDDFKKLQKVYLKQGIRPCFIVQISNEDKAEEELFRIKKILEQKSLNWVCFVEKEKGYETNTRLIKANKSLWQNYVKESTSEIDVVIFKMVITEGFDMPRACVLYQVRNSQSKQLDEQVIGRVRRNPMLENFEKLDKETQEVFSKAFVYGIKPEIKIQKQKVKLKGGDVHENLFKNEIIKEFGKIKISLYKEVPASNIDISPCLKNDIEYFGKSIFTCFKDLQKCEDKVKEKYAEIIKNYEDFFIFSANLPAIKDKVKEVVKDYENNLATDTIDFRGDVYSFYEKSEFEEKAKNWIWENDGNKENYKFSFDSKAESEFFDILEDLSEKYCKSIELEDNKIYLFGKNFIDNSNVKYEYYNTRKRTSYPDFIFKGKNNKIYLFEVKSANKSGTQDIDEKEYLQKITALKEAYEEASKKIGEGYVFCIPVKQKEGENWEAWWCENAKIENKTMSSSDIKDKIIDDINNISKK